MKNRSIESNAAWKSAAKSNPRMFLVFVWYKISVINLIGPPIATTNTSTKAFCSF